MSDTPICNHPACARATRETKPYCPEHVSHNSQAARTFVLWTLEQLRKLNGGKASLGRISREMKRSQAEALSVVKELETRGAVTVMKTNRGTVIVKLKGAR